MKFALFFCVYLFSVSSCGKIREFRQQSQTPEQLETITAETAYATDSDVTLLEKADYGACHDASPAFVIIDRATGSFHYCDRGAWKPIPKTHTGLSIKAASKSAVNSASARKRAKPRYKCTKGKTADYVCRRLGK